MENLVHFELYLSSTNITHEDIIPLFRHMPKVQMFSLSLGETKITNNTIEILTSTLSKMKDLIEVRLYLQDTLITTDSIIPLIHQVKNVKELYLNLRGIEIKDKFIYQLNLLIRSQLKKLEWFRLSINILRGLSQESEDLLNKLCHDYRPLTNQQP